MNYKHIKKYFNWKGYLKKYLIWKFLMSPICFQVLLVLLVLILIMFIVDAIVNWKDPCFDYPTRLSGFLWWWTALVLYQIGYNIWFEYMLSINGI